MVTGRHNFMKSSKWISDDHLFAILYLTKYHAVRIESKSLGFRGGRLPPYNSEKCFASNTDTAAPVSTRQCVCFPLILTSTERSLGPRSLIELAASFFWTNVIGCTVLRFGCLMSGLQNFDWLSCALSRTGWLLWDVLALTSKCCLTGVVNISPSSVLGVSPWVESRLFTFTSDSCSASSSYLRSFLTIFV